MARAIHPGLKPAGLPDVAGVGSEYRDPSPTPHGAQRGARHLPANLSGPSYSARLTTVGATRKGAPACVDGAEDAQHAANSPLPLASPGQYPVMDARGADPRASAGTSGFPGSSQPQQRASNPGANDERRGEVGRRLTTSRDSRRDGIQGPTGFDVEQRTHLTAPAGAHTAVITLGNDQSPTTTSPLFRLRPESVDTRGARVAYRRHHTSWTGAIRRRPVETQTVVEAPTPRRQGPLRAPRAAMRVSEGEIRNFSDPGSIPGGSTSQKQWAKGRVMPARRELITRGKLGVHVGPPRAACPRGGRTPALGRSGSRPPRTSGVMRSVEVALSGDGAQRRDSRERPAISLRSSMVEHHRRRTARGAFDGLPCLRGPDHSALTARGARLVDGGDARSIRAGGAVDKTQTEPLAHPTRGSVPVLRRCA